MSTFFFHLHECGEVLLDPEGVEANDLAQLHFTAIRAARDVMCGEVQQGRLCLKCHIEVMDDRGQSVLTVKFADALKVTGV